MPRFYAARPRWFLPRPRALNLNQEGWRRRCLGGVLLRLNQELAPRARFATHRVAPTHHASCPDHPACEEEGEFPPLGVREWRLAARPRCLAEPVGGCA